MPHSPRLPRAVRVVALTAIVALTFAAAMPSAGAAKKTKIKVTAGKVDLVRIGAAPDSFPADTQAQVLGVVRTYLESASAIALRKSVAEAAALATAFAPAALTDLSGTDRATVTDEGLPKARGRITMSVAPVAMTGLFDGDGKLTVVSAQLSQKAKWKSAKGKAKLVRRGELVLTGQDDGTWKISEYALTVTRSGKGLAAATTTTTTGTGATTTTAKATG